jgi:CRP-like cAMP-binding protein
LSFKTRVPAACTTLLKQRQSDCLNCAVRSTALFANLEAHELDWLKPIHNGLVEADNVIYREGAAAEAVFTVRSGVVKLVASNGGRNSRIIRLLGRGAAFGLESLDGNGYRQTAVAMRELNLCRIPIATLSRLGRQNPRLADGLINKWREHADWSERWIAGICTGQLKERAGSLLRLLVEISGDPPDALRLPRTSDMADILGCSMEGVSRCMAELKRRGLLERVAPWTYRCDLSLFRYSDGPSSARGDCPGGA